MSRLPTAGPGSPGTPDRLLIHDEAAQYLRMSPGALYNARHRGDAPPAFRRGRRLLYRERDLIAWVAARVVA